MKDGETMGEETGALAVGKDTRVSWSRSDIGFRWVVAGKDDRVVKTLAKAICRMVESKNLERDNSVIDGGSAVRWDSETATYVVRGHASESVGYRFELMKELVDGTF